MRKVPTMKKCIKPREVQKNLKKNVQKLEIILKFYF